MKSKRQDESYDIILRSSDIPPALLKRLEEIAEKQQRPIETVVISLIGRLLGFHIQ